MFVIKFQCKEALASDKKILTKSGEEYWVVNEPSGWVEATSSSIGWECGAIPSDVKTFRSAAGAESFIKRWKGHPWYCVPNGVYEIIEVKPKYKQVIEGWEEA